MALDVCLLDAFT
ncbi:hypothetical protein FLM03_15805 [Vibrio cholerae]|nr:hypothetical protein FLM03_15805 [Vibrio cholerae]TQQ12921.1 hypothetical protein FLL69_14475 [Vibrio cholerae]TQQ68058.1 hypothetical protein FLL82_18195 [Vibrio cholerae]